jgi:cyclophilin family peptidyl-prolyl cis-trans isomerase
MDPQPEHHMAGCPSPDSIRRRRRASPHIRLKAAPSKDFGGSTIGDGEASAAVGGPTQGVVAPSRQAGRGARAPCLTAPGCSGSITGRAASCRASPFQDNLHEVLTMTASSIVRRYGMLVAAAFLLAGAQPVTRAQEGSKEAGDLYVHIETRQMLTYTGDPHEVTILFKNNGKSTWTNPGMEIETGFQVFDSEGRKLEKAKTTASQKDAQPRVLEPNGYFGQILDLNKLFPKMTALGAYKITWSGPGVSEKAIMSKVIKKYDATKDYQAVIGTEFGDIILEFYKDLAPMHVKNFIDLANQGFYDNKIFHRTIKGEAVFGGSNTGDERGGPGYTLPAEPNGLKVLAGSVAQVRNTYTGSEESGSIFMVAVAPQPELDTRYTVFARVSQGLETVKTITNLPTAGGGGPRIAARPIRDVVMKKVEIREKAATKKSSS